MKKLTLALCVTSALASGVAEAQWEGNWLVGGSVGYVNREGNLATALIDQTGTFQQILDNHDLDDDGLLFGLLAGYQVRCPSNGLLLGLELNVDWYDGEDTHFFGNTIQNVFTQWADYNRGTVFGLTGRVGWQMASWVMPYLRAGIQGSQDRLTVTYLTNVNDNVRTAEEEQTVYGFVGGAGLEFPLSWCDRTTLRAEYNYHSSGVAVTAINATELPDVVNTAQTKQHANSGRVSLVYNFL